MQAFGKDPKQWVMEEKLYLRKQDLNANDKAKRIRAREEAGKSLGDKHISLTAQACQESLPGGSS